MPNELSNNSRIAVSRAVARLAGSPEWKNLIKCFRAEAGGDKNYDALVDEVRDRLMERYVAQTTSMRAS